MQQALPTLGLTRSLRSELSYEARAEGKIPESLRGTFFRLGPGLYKRGNVTKTTLLDGDGMMQAFHFEGGRAFYRNKFVKTPKFISEEKKDRFSFPTWTSHTRAPWFLNSGLRIHSQAGVAPVLRNGKLFAFDDVGLPFEMDPQSLNTLSEFHPLGREKAKCSFNAHSKLNFQTHEWTLLSTRFRRK